MWKSGRVIGTALNSDCWDEITEQGRGIERGLIWSMVHSVEMARAVVDALLDGVRTSR
ncbi:hypothetical protein [Pseudomonas chlororaphis]|uniref:hypothetical protein n=1 Tax=Pseudomonas chlororaphis TaxID=587753 RepID=UPI0015DE4E5A|nr:hypothetical protein [Pseudomonas chlororaphis]QLL10551.1 hypothetical protein H0I86_09410 [Pseudomonas chlororaphis subsp. aurantiaca]